MSSGRTVHTSNESVDELSGEMALLMRHSSPIVRGGQEVTSPLAQRRTLTPSPLRMHRPRSNPRTRTPMRFESPLQQLRIDEANEGVVVEEHEARRITIRPMAGAAVGTAVNMRMAGTRVSTISMLFLVFFRFAHECISWRLSVPGNTVLPSKCVILGKIPTIILSAFFSSKTILVFHVVFCISGCQYYMLRDAKYYIRILHGYL